MTYSGSTQNSSYSKRTYNKKDANDLAQLAKAMDKQRKDTVTERFGLRFGSQVGAMLASEIAPWPPQMRPKTHLGARIRPYSLQTSILIDFLWIYDGFLVDFWWILAQF